MSATAVLRSDTARLMAKTRATTALLRAFQSDFMAPYSLSLTVVQPAAGGGRVVTRWRRRDAS